MKKILGFVSLFYSLICTAFLVYFCCVEGSFELKAKPAWVIILIYILGMINAVTCMEVICPTRNKK